MLANVLICYAIMEVMLMNGISVPIFLDFFQKMDTLVVGILEECQS